MLLLNSSEARVAIYNLLLTTLKIKNSEDNDVFALYEKS